MQICLGACGLVCNCCEAYKATAADDKAKLEKLAAHWRDIYQNPDITAETVRCRGCMSEGGCRSVRCERGCEIRKCALEHDVSICGQCKEFPCARIDEFFTYFGEGSEAQRQLHEAVANVAAYMEKTLDNFSDI